MRRLIHWLWYRWYARQLYRLGTDVPRSVSDRAAQNITGYRPRA